MQRNGREEGDPALALLGEELLSRILFKPKKESAQRASSIFDWIVPTSFVGLLLSACVSALCGVAILYILNTAAHLIEDDDYSLTLAVQFVIVLLIYRYSQRITLKQASSAVEEALHQWRLRINVKVADLSLSDLEALSRERVLDGLARNYQQLSQTIITLAAALEAQLSLAFMLVYLFFVSVTAGLLTCLVAAAAILSFLSIARLMQEALSDTAKAEVRFSRLAEGLTDGFKELRLSAVKRDAVEQDLAHTSATLAQARAAASDLRGAVITSANSSANLLPAAVVFLLPILAGSSRTDLSAVVTAILFLLGPIGGMVRGLQELPTAQFAASEITAFEREIDNLRSTGEQDLPGLNTLDQLHLKGVDYVHPASSPGVQGFAITEIDLTLERGKVVFITGANGSGKTTLLRVLTGLYPRQNGQIIIDDTIVAPQTPQAYRELFSVVFADFHLFDKPYGLDEDGMRRLNDMLKLLGIREKLPEDLAAGYDPEKLSTGQRKRLALAIALAEDRPILVLDEWAADQDPATRERFYTEVLPLLKASGRAIVAVSHDDRYFDCADAHFHMADGRLQRVTPA
jgi:putative ATP-binding cassette transporter